MSCQRSRACRALSGVGAARLTNPALRRWLAALAAAYLRLVARTGRWRITIDPAAEAHLRADGRCLAAFWHGRLAMTPFLWRTMLTAAGLDAATPACALISHHADGSLIADTVGRLGIEAVRGSTSRGGREAFWAMRRRLRDGATIAIAVDGPRGPRERAQSGVIELARSTGEAILPITFAARPAIVLRSWDGFVLPLPFARGVLAWGAPIRVPRSVPLIEPWRLELEGALMALTLSADREV